MVNRYIRNLIVWAVILLVALPVAFQLWRRSPREEIAYSTFVEQVEAGQVTAVEIGDGVVTGRLKGGQQFTVYIPQGDTSYIDLLKSKGVPIRAEPRSRSSLWPSLLSTLLPILLLVGVWMLLLRQSLWSNQIARFIKSREGVRTIITPPALPPPRGFSHGIVVQGGQLLFLAGQDGSDLEGRIVGRGDLVRQFEQVIQNIQVVVEAAGGTLKHVTKLNIFVRDRRAYIDNLKPIGEIFRRHFNGHYPAMALFEVNGFFRDEALIEIEGMAVIP